MAKVNRSLKIRGIDIKDNLYPINIMGMEFYKKKILLILVNSNRVCLMVMEL